MSRAALLTFGLFAALPAWAAKEDQPIPYSDQEEAEDRRRELPRKSQPTPFVREETDVEQKDREISLTHLDDPNLGLAIELVAGVMLLDASRGVVGEARFLGGARFTWEFGRLIPDEFVREMFFLDVMYAYTEQTEGTDLINVTTNYHYFALAPAVAIPFGAKSPIAVFIQGGVGFNVQPIVVNSQGDPVTLAGTKALMQYGGGFRFRPALVADEKVRLSFRLEFTRFCRGYMDDTFLGGSMGLSFEMTFRLLLAAALLLGGCECSKAPTPAEPTRLTAEVLTQLAKCKELETAFAPAPRGKDESLEDAQRRKVMHAQEHVADIAQACGFASPQQYLALNLRAEVARAERTDEQALASNPPPTPVMLREREAQWAAEIDAGRMDVADLEPRRKVLAEAGQLLDEARARKARRASQTSLDVTVLTDAAGDSAPALVEKLTAEGKKQPPLSDEERRLIERWKKP